MDSYSENLLTEFGRHLSTRGRSRNTINAYVSDARQFLAWSLVAIEPGNVAPQAAAWIRNAPAAHATVNRRMASIRAFAKAVYGIDILVDHQMRRPAKGVAHPLPDGVDDIRRMLEQAPEHHRPLIALCGYAGARCHEARQVRGLDVHQDDDGNWWVLLHGKGSADRRVPLPDEAIPYLNLEASQGGSLCKLSDRGARYAITNAGLRAGVTRPVASHDLRMTFGTEVYAQTKDLRLTQELMGHQSSKTTENYTGIRQSQMVEAVQAVFA
jgi:site-specific recombinase XerD